MTYSFQPGVAYKFTPCDGMTKSFIAVAAERDDAEGVGFVLPLGLIRGVQSVMDGREFVKVKVDGFDYVASSAAPMEMSAAFELLDQIRDAREKGCFR